MGTTRWGVALAAIFFTLVLLGANQLQLTEAAPLYPVCAGDLRHLSWVWHFPVDGSKEAIAQKLSASRMGVILKSHDGTDWMSTYDHSPDAVSGPAQVGKLADFFESRGVPFFTYAVVKGQDPITEAHMAAQVLNSGARGIIFDLEPWAGYWRGSPHSAQVFGQELRRLAPQGVVITAVEPRPWVLPNVPVAEFAAFSDALATMDYWETYRSNGPLFAAWGYPPGPEGITPEFLIDVGAALLDRYNLPVLPIGQGPSQDLGAWARFVQYAAQRGMPAVSVWRHGVTYPPVFDLLRDRFPGGWSAVCGEAPVAPFLTGDFNGDRGDDLLHLTRRDFVRPWTSRGDGSFGVGFARPWAGYGIQSGRWFAGKFNSSDIRDDLIHLTESDYANVWIAGADGSFSVSTFRPWPGYWVQGGSWQTGDFNDDGLTDLAHLTNGDFVHIWTAQPDGTFGIGTFRPWPGYAVQNGSWQTGDFNGDGRDDLVHLTAADYVHTWTAQPDGTFSVATVRPWPGYGVQSGGWQVGDFDGDGLDDLVHLTAGDYVNVWLGQSDGSFGVRSFRPWSGYGIQTGSWQTGDYNGDGRDDLVHLAGFDYAHLWSYQPGGAFAVGTLRPWPGYQVQIGTWQTGDFNGDGHDDLVHITGRDYVHPWVSQPDGGFWVATFQPWPGYRI